MNKKTHIIVEAALVAGVLITGLATAQAARAASVESAANMQRNMRIESIVQIERVEKDASGAEKSTLHDPKSVKVIPGDRLVFTNKYRNRGGKPVTGFVVNNPVHPAVGFTAVREDWALVSVDGGKSFGKLSELTVAIPAVEASEGVEAQPATTRAAQPGDVTHIRWIFAKPIAAGAAGNLVFRGVVK